MFMVFIPKVDQYPIIDKNYKRVGWDREKRGCPNRPARGRMTKWCGQCQRRFQAEAEDLEWRVAKNGNVMVVGICPRCGATTGTSFAPVAQAPASVQAEARVVARTHREARAALQAFRNAVIVLAYADLAPKRRRGQAFSWHGPTVARLSQWFPLSERRVREILEATDAAEAAELIEGMRRRETARRSRSLVTGITGLAESEIKLPGTF